MKIVNAVCSPGRTGFFFDDQRAIKQGAVADGNMYKGSTVTPGFSSVRQAGESVSVMLILEDGQVAWGDCAAVQYSGAGGRDPLFLAKDFIPVIEEQVLPRLLGQEADSFRRLTTYLDEIKVGDAKLHTAIGYGVSQAILDAVAKGRKKMMCEIIVEEYDLELTSEEVPLFTQSGDARYDNVDKMILKGAHVMPHALINNVAEKLGRQGELLKEYITWMSSRIQTYRPYHNYEPILHVDVYGTIGQIFGPENYERIAEYLEELAAAAHPFKLRIEGPVDMEERQRTIEALSAITRLVDERKIGVEIVADEWCNTFEDIKAFADHKAGHMIQIKTPDLGSIHHVVEAVLYCKEKGVGAYQGGTCNETDRSAQVCVHLAMATKPAQMLAKPGMGVDEGYMVVYNEMQRIRALLEVRDQHGKYKNLEL